MDPHILKKLSDHFADSPIRSYHKGQIITLANQEPAGVLWLQEGVVEQYDITPDGNKVTVNMFKPPAFFPMSWAINKTPNEYFFAALSDVKLKQADAAGTVEFLQSNPDVTFDLLGRVYRGTDALLKRLMLATSGIATSRLTFELLIEAYRFGVKLGNGKYLIKVTQSNLAARSGLARETISRELHKLAEQGFISHTKNGVEIDTEKLEAKLGS